MSHRRASSGRNAQRQRAPDRRKSERRPHAPGGVAPEIEVVAVAHLARDARELRRLRRAVLEVHVVDERDRDRDDERPEEPEGGALVSPMREAAQYTEHEEREGERCLKSPGCVPCESRSHCHLKYSHHMPICAVNGACRSVRSGLPYWSRLMFAINRVAVVLRERASETDLLRAAGRLAFVQRRMPRRANRLDGERREAEHHRQRAGQQQPPTQQRARPPDDHRDGHGRTDQQTRRMIAVSESDEIRDHHQQPVGDRSIGIVAPAHGEPRHDREERERHGVHLFVHDALIPHRERRCAEQCRGHRGHDACPSQRRPRDEHTLGHEKPDRGRDGAAHRRERVDAHRDRAQRHERGDAAEEHEQRIARRMRNAERVRGGDVLARIPHRRRGRERREIEREHGDSHKRRDADTTDGAGSAIVLMSASSPCEDHRRDEHGVADHDQQWGDGDAAAHEVDVAEEQGGGRDGAQHVRAPRRRERVFSHQTKESL